MKNANIYLKYVLITLHCFSHLHVLLNISLYMEFNYNKSKHSIPVHTQYL